MILITIRQKINTRIQSHYKPTKYNNLSRKSEKYFKQKYKYYNITFYMEMEALTIVSIIIFCITMFQTFCHNNKSKRLR